MRTDHGGGNFNEFEEIKKYLSIIGKWGVRAAAGIAVLAGILGSIYVVPTESNAVITRFGRYVRTTEPGIHLKIPYGIEKRYTVPVRTVQKEEFGFRTVRAGVKSEYLRENIDKISENELRQFILESGEWPKRDNLKSQMNGILQDEYRALTGDLNIADVEWIVQYRIKDAANFLFNVRNQKKTLRDVSESVMKGLIGDRSVDEVITIGRVEMETEARDKMQNFLDAYDTGIQVVTVKLQASHPPLNVRPAFNGVNEAMQMKERRINEAMKEYNEVIPKAQGDADRIVRNAEGYAMERTNRARGDANKFLKILGEYEKAPDITERRLYLEAMQDFLDRTGEKIVIDEEGLRGVLKFLDLRGSSAKEGE